MAERREHARLNILWWITQFCITHVSSGDRSRYPSISGFVISRECRVGDLIRLQSAPCSPWYLSWLVELEPATESRDARYLCESIETGELCWWSNVGIDFMEREEVEKHPEWRWTDRQFAFNGRWHRVCHKKRNAYIVLPVQARFGEDFQVTLGTRTRFGWDDHRPTKTFDDWRKVTKAMMLEFYDECVSSRPGTKPDTIATDSE